MKEKFDVTGMTCSACSSRVEKCVSRLPGVTDVSVNLLTNSMQAEFDESALSVEDIISAVSQAGYGASVKQTSAPANRPSNVPAGPKEDPVELELRNMRFRLIISVLFMLPLMYLSMGHMAGLPQPSWLSGKENAISFAFTQFLLALPIAYVNRKFYIKGFGTLMHGAPNMDTLIAIGSTSAFAYGIFAIYRMSYALGIGNMALVHHYHENLYFESAVMILTLITVGKYLEARSKGKTSEVLKHLMELAPKTALVLRNGEELEIPVEQVRLHETVLVKPGQRIPVDGIVLDGHTSVDQSAITGESIPVEKSAGDEVIAATVNKGGFIRVSAGKVGEDTTFAQIVRLVEEASASKAPIAQMADKIAGVFVPAVIAIATLTAIVWLLAGQTFEFALSCAICVLVISCPCALGLATPVAIMVGTGKGAENGILIKSGEALERAHSIQTVVLDKTGTITEGKPVVTDIICKGNDTNRFLQLAASLEAGSEHPLAEAIISCCKEKNLDLLPFGDFQAISGKGVKATIDERSYYAGNQRLMQDLTFSSKDWDDIADGLANDGKTPLYFADETGMIGLIAVADPVKPTSLQAIKTLQDMNIRVVMLTGDNRKTAEAIQRRLQVDEVIAEVLPQDKEAKIAEIQATGRIVAMVGDGINDAPALARADVGMAIGAGTDIAMESADIVLMKNDLLDVVTSIQLSKATIRNIKQNLFWAFFYNVLCIPLAAGLYYPMFHVLLNPMIGAACMSFSSIFVVTNALRLRGFKPDLTESKTPEAASEAGFGISIVTDFSNSISTNEPIECQFLTSPSTPEGSGPVNTDIYQKVMHIEGMMCHHCQKRVTDALNALDGVDCKVSLEDNAAYICTKGLVDDRALIQAVTDADYQVISLEDYLSDNTNNISNKKEGFPMKKNMIIEGMMCQHCSKAVTNALNALEGVTCEVSLEDKAAYITTTGAVTDEALIQAVTAADYKVISLNDAE